MAVDEAYKVINTAVSKNHVNNTDYTQKLIDSALTITALGDCFDHSYEEHLAQLQLVHFEVRTCIHNNTYLHTCTHTNTGQPACDDVEASWLFSQCTHETH